MAAAERAGKSAGAMPLHVFLFDDRRGDKEGQEADKILGYCPASTPVDQQTSAVGLAQAILTFNSTFQPDAPCDVIHTQQKRWILECCEPHLWLAMVVDREWHKGPVREEGLAHTLRQLHTLATLTHGPLEGLLLQDATGKVAREAVQGVLEECCGRLARRRGPEYSALHNPLAATEAVPLLHLPTPLFLGMQTLVNRVVVSPLWASTPVVGLLLLHEAWLLWSSLPRADTCALYQLFTWAVLPAIKAASAPSLGRRLTRSASLRPPGSRVSMLHKTAWHLAPNGLLLASSGKSSLDGPVQAEEIFRTHSIWLQSAQEWCCLVVLQVMDHILLLLLPGDTQLTRPLAEGLVSAVAPGMRAQSTQVARHLQATRRLHVPGFRYLFTDDVLVAVRASPGVKVSTLSRQSLALVNSVKEDFERQLQGKEDSVAETAVWGQHDCWVVALCRGPRRLYVVLEQQGKEGLLPAFEAAEEFAHAQFPGLFA